ncbi:hypothetical protein [Microbacterium sp. NIBRBAC000506063]|uniref:hypothetical protein n=1 Tax=Microbacterium sp. NIBRBAC000506063 TaxID=2734618 RepID=UPI001BB4F3EE|nr:hypothetical protein [Microbacterium sp. NIBRBAC000506063]QTV80920.1 hypothetical protein KAE78_14200 [Microbacterium sp. NIBRBAC000506063]
MTWLCRDQAGIDRPMEPRGQRLSRAVRGWFAEWTCGENDPATKVVWLGAATCPQVEDLHQELRERYPVLQHGPSASFHLGGEEI